MKLGANVSEQQLIRASREDVSPDLLIEHTTSRFRCARWEASNPRSDFWVELFVRAVIISGMGTCFVAYNFFRIFLVGQSRIHLRLALARLKASRRGLRRADMDAGEFTFQ
jgi:hypothetical protein